MIRIYAEIFCWKNVSSFCSTHIFSAKNIRILYIESAKTVKEMTLNELVKLTLLWTTGPGLANILMSHQGLYHLLMLSMTLIDSAGWYGGHQCTFLIYAFALCICPWCTFLHSTALAIAGLSGSVGCASDWRPDRGFHPRWGWQHSFMEIDHEIFSTVILSLPLIQEGQLSVSGERMCTVLVKLLRGLSLPNKRVVR